MNQLLTAFGRSSAVRARVLGVFALCLATAHATTLARMDLRELVGNSTHVARVRCVNSVSFADLSRVWTVSTFEVAEAWKGTPPPRFAVRLPGGTAAGRRETVEGAPRFAVGEEAVLFLGADRGGQMNIVSWAQGTFRIRKNVRTGIEEAVQDLGGVPVFDPQSRAWSKGGLQQISVASLRSTVIRVSEEAAR